MARSNDDRRLRIAAPRRHAPAIEDNPGAPVNAARLILDHLEALLELATLAGLPDTSVQVLKEAKAEAGRAVLASAAQGSRSGWRH